VWSVESGFVRHFSTPARYVVRSHPLASHRHQLYPTRNQLYPHSLSLSHTNSQIKGGKGGFGNLLRHVKATEKIDNYDACRDLSGRRYRLVEAERKLSEWEEKQKNKPIKNNDAEELKRLEVSGFVNT